MGFDAKVDASHQKMKFNQTSLLWCEETAFKMYEKNNVLVFGTSIKKISHRYT